jgi:hypothetical protein
VDAEGGRMRGRDQLSAERPRYPRQARRPLIRPASRVTFSRKGRRTPVNCKADDECGDFYYRPTKGILSNVSRG